MLTKIWKFFNIKQILKMLWESKLYELIIINSLIKIIYVYIHFIIHVLYNYIKIKIYINKFVNHSFSICSCNPIIQTHIFIYLYISITLISLYICNLNVKIN